MIPGLDRSHLNSGVKLTKLTSKGIKFIWFKASQGATNQDPTFNASWQEAKATPGLIRGAYHFFDPRIDGVVQAKNFLSLKMSFTSVGCLPPCVDVEDLVGYDDNGKESDTVSAQLNKWVADNWQLAVQRLTDFLNYVKTETGWDCVIYTYNNYPKEYFHGHGFINNPMWLSSLQANCPVRYDTGKLPEFWQNTYRWQGGDQDGDYFMGTQDELNKLANIIT
jgi:lysozyme